MSMHFQDPLVARKLQIAAACIASKEEHLSGTASAKLAPVVASEHQQELVCARKRPFS